MKNEAIKKWGIPLLITTLLFVFTFVLYNITFQLNDDVTISKLLSGKYTGSPEFMTYYFSVPLGFIISLFYKLIPALPWFALFFISLYFICFLLITKRILSLADSMTEKKGLSKAYIITIPILLFFLVFIENITLLHYTLLSAISAATGIFLLITKQQYEDAKSTCLNNITAIILIILSYLIRENVFFMMLPFLAVSAIHILINNNKNTFAKYIPIIIIFILSFLVFYSINKLAFSQESWKTYTDYNDARTRLYDFVNISKDNDAMDYYSKALGYESSQDPDFISQYDLYRSYNILLSDLNADRLNKLSDYELSNKKSFYKHFRDALYMYRQSFFSMPELQPLIYVIMAIYIIFLVIIFAYKDLKQILTIILLFIARSGVWCYIFWNNRYPKRVTYSLIYFELFILLALIFLMAKKHVKRLILSDLLPMIFIITILAGSIYAMQNMTNDYKEIINQNAQDKVLYDYISKNPDSFYFIDVYASVNYTEPAFSYNDSLKDNYHILGGWMAKSPLLEKKLRQFNITNIKADIVNKDNIYLVLKDKLYNGITIKDYENWLNADFSLIDSIENDNDKFLIYKAVK